MCGVGECECSVGERMNLQCFPVVYHNFGSVREGGWWWWWKVNSTVCSCTVAVGWVGLGVVERKMGAAVIEGTIDVVCVAVVVGARIGGRSEWLRFLRCGVALVGVKTSLSVGHQFELGLIVAGRTYIQLTGMQNKKNRGSGATPPSLPPSSLDCAKQCMPRQQCEFHPLSAPRRAGWVVVGGCCLLSPPFRSSLPLQYCRSV